MPATKTAKKRKSKAQLNREFLGTTKLWKLLKMALADLLACERDTKRYVIDMGTYIRQNGKCAVCLAGACLVRHGVTEDQIFNMHSDPDLDNRADALDSLRAGFVGCAAKRMGINRSATHLDREIVTYCLHRKLWWSQMRTLLADLRKADL